MTAALNWIGQPWHYIMFESSILAFAIAVVRPWRR
jgi:hypothetical protein